MKNFIAAFVVLSVVALCCVFIFDNTEENQIKPKTTTVNVTQKESETKENKIYAVWLTYSEIGALVKDKSKNEYIESLETVFNDLKKNKINTVFYQCRAFCDSFYQSEIFPVSKYIGNAGIGFDPFGVFCETAQVYGISVHCWINPYRVSYDKEYNNLPRNSPAKALYKKDKTSLIICENGVYLNPAHSESRKLVLDGIKEILGKYKVGGIHFDDYFYPESEKLNDKKLYEEYRKQGGKLNLPEWRRENVSALVSGVYTLVKSYDHNLIFSISPSADIKKCKNVFYADVEKWCSEDGFADYIIPQLYYGFENESMPFSYVAEEWRSLASQGSVKLICGMAPYKSGSADNFAGNGKNEWNENVNILSRQYEQVLKSQVWQGFSLFSYSYCFGDNMTENSKKEIKNLLYVVE